MDTKILSQPLQGFCGQTCIALIKNISVEYDFSKLVAYLEVNI